MILVSEMGRCWSLVCIGVLINTVPSFLQPTAHFDTQRRLPLRVKIVEVGPRDGLQNEQVRFYGNQLYY